MGGWVLTLTFSGQKLIEKVHCMLNLMLLKRFIYLKGRVTDMCVREGEKEEEREREVFQLLAHHINGQKSQNCATNFIQVSLLGSPHPWAIICFFPGTLVGTPTCILIWNSSIASHTTNYHSTGLNFIT